MLFRTHKINRTCKKSYKNYKSYKSYLAEDFGHRCAYCNLLDTEVSTSFEIDHFVPQEIIKKYPSQSYLISDYNNLIYACKNCNGAKSNLYKGDIINRPYDNDKFYDPVNVDYNTIFFRDKYGTISSKDQLGISMIIDLKLYRPINNLAWICEQLDLLISELNEMISTEFNCEKVKLLKEAKYQALEYYWICKKIHTSNYENKKFHIFDIVI